MRWGFKADKLSNIETGGRGWKKSLKDASVRYSIGSASLERKETERLLQGFADKSTYDWDKHNPWMATDEVKLKLKLKQSFEDLPKFINRQKSADLSGTNISAKMPADRTLDQSLAMQEQQTLIRAKKMNNMVRAAAKARGISMLCQPTTHQNR